VIGPSATIISHQFVDPNLRLLTVLIDCRRVLALAASITVIANDCPEKLRDRETCRIAKEAASTPHERRSNIGGGIMPKLQILCGRNPYSPDEVLATVRSKAVTEMAMHRTIS
jgi:hypothetical protein